jgi:hypothetical protein
VILLDGVILDEAMPDQVRLHHVIFLEKLVLAGIAWTNGALPTQMQAMLFCSGNKLSHMTQETHIVADPRYLVHPLFPIYDRDDLAHTHTTRIIKSYE